MRTLHGTSINPGIVIALAVVVNERDGLSKLPENVIMQGIKAIRKGLSVQDQPEVILLCDKLSFGAAVQIPGIHKAGIACQESGIGSGVQVDVPCLIGVEGLLSAAGTEDIAILDADNEIIYLDPDVRVLVQYQSELEPSLGKPVELDIDRKSAISTGGIIVSAVVSSLNELEQAIEQGADRLVILFDDLVEHEIELRADSLMDPEVEMFGLVSAIAADVPFSMVVEAPSERLVSLMDRLEYADLLIGSERVPDVLDIADVEMALRSGVREIFTLSHNVLRARQMVMRWIGNADE